MYASAQFDRGICFADLGRPDASEESYRRAERIWADLREEFPAEAAFASRYAGTLNHRGILNQNTGRPERAIELYEASLEARRAWAETHPDDADNALYLAGTLCNLGHTYRQLAQRDRAAEAYRDAADRLAALRSSQGASERLEAFQKNVRDGQAVLAQMGPSSIDGIQSATLSVSRLSGPPPLQREHAYPEFSTIRDHLEQDDPLGAIVILDALLIRQADHHEARLDRADLLRSQNRSTESLADLDRLHSAHPDDAMAWYQRGLVLGRFLDMEGGPAEPLDRAELDEAIDAFDEATLLEPTDFAIRYWKGQAHLSAAHAAQARYRAWYAVAESSMGRDAATELVKMPVARYRCEFSRSRESFETALRLKPDAGEAWYALGRLLIDLESGHEDDARKALRKAVEFRPTLPGPWLELAKLADRDNVRDLARDCVRQLCRLDGSYRPIVRRLFHWVTDADLGAG